MTTSNKLKTKGILNPRAVSQEFDLSRSAPAADLGDFIECFWMVTWDLRARKSYLSETLPFPTAHIVIEKRRSKVYGVMTSKFSRRLEGKGRAFGIKFRPGMFYPFLNSPVSKLTDRSGSLRAIFGNEGVVLGKAILAEDDEAKCRHVAEVFFRERLPKKVDSTAVTIRDLVERIATDRGITRVDQVAAMLGMNLRSLQRTFLRYVGVSPKWVINRYRLQEAADTLAKGYKVNMSDLAIQLGYFDQAHFIKEFKSIIGKTPLEYFKSV